MTPKEKAKDLFNKMYFVDDPMGNYPMCFDTAKQCALIAVDEILINIDFIWADTITTAKKHKFKGHKEYWQEVKHEIEQL